MNTKKIYKFSGILAPAFMAAILLSSCEKDVLDLQPYSSFSDLSAFTTVERVNLAINGVYDAAQSGFYEAVPGSGATQVRGYPFGAASIEQGDMRGEDMLNQALFYQITYEATHSISSANNVNMFMTLYSLINKANLTMEGVLDAGSKGIIPAEQATAYAAEMRFLRAMAHHELVLNFSRPFADGSGNKMGIIYRETGINSEAKANEARAVKRSDFTVAQNYSKILEDLDFAETNLPATGVLKTYRASKAAAIALKMRVKMHMGDWAGVKTEGAKIISGTFPTYSSPIGGWKLTAGPDGPFISNTSDESVFSIKNDATDNPGVNAGLANMLGDPAAPVGGRGLVRISPILWSDARWHCDDKRRTVLSRAYESSAYTYKYKDVTTLSDAAPLIRYAEVLMMMAEAEARTATGVSETALNLLNAVRNRSLADAGDAFTTADFATADDLVAAILFERRVEFIGEGKRWGDIHRLALDPVHAPIEGGGIPSKVGTGSATAAMFNCEGANGFTRAVAAIPYSDHRFLWPIPEIEIRQNPNYDQNPNY